MGALALLGVAWFVKARFFPRSLESEARRALDCAQAGDGACLAGYELATETRAYGLGKVGMTRLLREYVNPAFRTAEGHPTEEISPFREQGEVTLIRRWPRSGSSEPLERSVSVAATPEGAKSGQLVRSVVLNAWYASYHRDGDSGSYPAFIRGIDHDGARLTALGLEGFYNPDSGSLVRWSAIRTAWGIKLAQRGFPVPSPVD